MHLNVHENIINQGPILINIQKEKGFKYFPALVLIQRIPRSIPWPT